MISPDAWLLAGVTVVGVIAPQLFMHRQNRNDRRKSEARFESQLIEHPLHSHAEVNEFAQSTDTLTVAGVRYPRKNGRG